MRFHQRLGYLLIGLLLNWFLPGISRAQISNTTSLPASDFSYSDYLKKNLKLQWRMGLQSESFNEQSDEATFTQFRLRFRSRLEFSEYFVLKASPFVVLGSGRVQSRFEDTATRDKTGVREASLLFRPTSWFDLEGGILNQGPWKMEFFSDEETFVSYIGVKAKLSHKWEKSDSEWLRLTLSAQEAIPGSRSLNTQRSEKEKEAKLQTQGLQATWNRDQVLVQTHYSHFSFSNLPSVTAFESKRMGNYENPGVETNSSFPYQFAGQGYGASVCYEYYEKRMARFYDPKSAIFSERRDLPCSGSISWQRLQNTKAPRALSKGERVSASASLFVTENIRFQAMYGVYFKEAYVAPGAFSSATLGGTNRVGRVSELRADFLNQGFTARAQWVNADVINQVSNPFQGKLDRWFIGLESQYVWF